MQYDDELGPRIVVVGPCAAGKTTLINNLRPKGYNIRSCAQEHSDVPRLWQRHSRPEVLIFLNAGLSTVAERQDRPDWTQTRLHKQRQRLALARSQCDFYLRTDDLTCGQVAEYVEAYLRGRGIVPGGGAENEC